MITDSSNNELKNRKKNVIKTAAMVFVYKACDFAGLDGEPPIHIYK